MALVVLASVAAPRGADGQGAASPQTVLTFTEKLEVSDAGNGSYFPSFAVEERAGWPRAQWPRGEARSRRVLVDLAAREIDRGAVVVLFGGGQCARCAMVLDLFHELDVPAALVDYSALDEAGGAADEGGARGGEGSHEGGEGGQARATMGERVRRALRQLDVTGAEGSEEPAVFLGTRLLGMALEVEAMLYTGELHARLRVYGVLPRIMPPVNRAPVVRIQPRATLPEGQRLSVAWESSWVHPTVLGKLQVTVIEARGLTAFSYSYDAVQRRVLRGALPTPAHAERSGAAGGSIFGQPVSNPFVELELEGVRMRGPVQRATLDPVWRYNATFVAFKNPNALLEVTVLHADEKPPQLDPFYHGDPGIFFYYFLLLHNFIFHLIAAAARPLLPRRPRHTSFFCTYYYYYYYYYLFYRGDRGTHSQKSTLYRDVT